MQNSRLLIVFISSVALTFSLGLKLPSAAAESSSKTDSPVELAIGMSHEQIPRGGELIVAVRFQMQDEWHIYGRQEPVGTPTKLRILPESDFTVVSTALSEAVTHQFQIGDESQTSYFLKDNALAVAALKHDGGEDFALALEVIYQPCTETTCSFVKKERIEHEIPEGAYREQVDFNQSFARDVQSLLQPEQPLEDAPQEALSQALILALLQAFLWGVLASLTPCVYPMIPITVSLFSTETEDESRVRRFLRALAYVCGIVLSYAILGLVAAKTGRDLGSFLAIREVAVGLSLLMALMATSLFGWWEMDLPASLKQRLGTYEGRGPLGLFLMGGAMGFVAAPCVGPFAAAIIVWIVANPQDLMAGFLMMASFGAGLGVLFLALAVFSQNILPRSGGWMVDLKQIMGWLLMGVAWHFQTTFYSAEIVTLGWGVWTILFGCMLGAFEPMTVPTVLQRLKKGLAWVFLIQGVLWMVLPQWPEARGMANVESGDSRTSNQHATAAKALQAGQRKKRPVMLYFSAKWCIPCRQIKSDVLPDPGVRELLSEFEWAIADATQSDSEAARLKSEVYQSAAMPFFAFHDASGKRMKALELEGKVGVDKLSHSLKAALNR